MARSKRFEAFHNWDHWLVNNARYKAGIFLLPNGRFQTLVLNLEMRSSNDQREAVVVLHYFLRSNWVANLTKQVSGCLLRFRQRKMKSVVQIAETSLVDFGTLVYLQSTGKMNLKYFDLNEILPTSLG